MLVDQPDDGQPQHDQAHRRRDGEEQHRAQHLPERAAQRRRVLRRDLGRERREDDRRHRLRDQALRQHHHVPGPVERRQASFDHAGGQRLVHPEVDLHDGLPSTRGPISRATSRTPGSVTSMSRWYGARSFSRPGTCTPRCSTAPSTTPHAAPKMPMSKSGAMTTAPMMMPMEYIDGASAGSRKRWCAFSTPICSPLMPNTMGEMSMMRISRTVSAVASASKPGAMT